MRNFSVLTIISFFLCLTTKAENIRFQSLNVDDGLPYSAVRSITQDKLGYIWIGTDIGLARFNGSEIKSYHDDKGISGTLPNSYILSLEVGPNNSLWIGTGNGLSLYNRERDNFTVFQHDSKESNSLSSNIVKTIKSTDKTNLWIGTENGLNFFEPKNKNFTHYINTSNPSLEQASNNIRALLPSGSQTLYVGTSAGLFVFSTEEKEFTLLSIGEKGAQPAILSLELSPSGFIWIGTEQGLYKYHPKTKSSEKIDFEKNVETVLSLLVDRDDNIWVGTFEHGLFQIEPNGKLTNHFPDKGRASSLADKSVRSLYQEDSGVILVGTLNSGINYFDTHALAFGSYDNSKTSINCLPSSDIRTAMAITNSQVALGTIEGLSILNLKTQECRNFDANEHISNKEVFSLLTDSDGTFWIGTGGGIDRYEHELSKFDTIKSELDISVYGIIEVNSNLYLAVDSGLVKLDKATSSLHYLKGGDDEIFTGSVFAFEKDRFDRLWLATTVGVYYYDDKRDQILEYVFSESELNGLPVRAIEIDNQGAIWFPIDGVGIMKFEPENDSISNIGRNIGINQTEGFSGIYQDHFQNIWIATLSQGLYRINKQETGFEKFELGDGLHSNVFNFGSFTSFPDGRVLFGGKNGFNLFSPNKIIKNNSPPKISITEYLKFGKAIKFTDRTRSTRINSDNLTTHSLELSYKDKIFGFELTPFHLASDGQINIAYQLEGLENDWNYTNIKSSTVSYNQLSAGSYLLKVKAQSKNGVWGDITNSVQIIKSPPPWLTWWAYSIYIFASIVAIILFIRKRTKTLELRALRLEAVVRNRTQELSEEKQKVEQLLSKKNEEFANVSHEFRTPLTLVLGPVAQLLEKANDETSINKLNIIQRNGYRLLRMVDQLLNIETFRIKTIAKKSPQAIGKNTKLMCEAFSDLAEANEMKLSFTGENNINFEFTQDAYEKILLNLLSNAIKYSKPGAEITVETLRTKNNEYHLSVKDTGIGIPADKIDSVFERYNRVMDENSEQVTGAGIGLALVKELVEAHQGSIKLQSKLGEGTQIDIYLPIINEVSDEEVATGSNADLIDIELVSLSNQKLNEEKSSEETIEQTKKESTVLVIEDNADMRQYISNSLNDQYRVLAANNGKAGVELAIAEVPDVIVSDIMMPVMDGYEATKAIRNNEVTSHIPLVLLTARGDRESRLRGWNEKADEYLTKPFDVEELKIRLANLLEIRNLLKKKFAETIFVEKQTAVQEEVVKDKTDIYSNKQKQQQIFIDKLNNYLESHYSETELTVPQISKAVLMSERQFFRKLKSVVDLSPVEYLRRYRLERGKELLAQGLSTNRTAFDVGFSSQGYFGRCFKAQYGVSPSEYKKQLQSEN